MFYIRDEGEPVKNGFNFYPLDSFSSMGFVLRIGARALWIRYSKFTKKLSCSWKRFQEYTDVIQS